MIFKIHQRGVQWKQGVVVQIRLYTVLVYNTSPIHCTSLPLHPPLRNVEICLLQDTAEHHGKAAAEHAGHAENSAENAFSRTRFQPNTRSARAEHAFSPSVGYIYR